MERIEKKVSDTLLQQEITVKIGDKTYQAAPPSTATLILVSEAVSRLPHEKFELKADDNVVQPCLSMAKDCTPIGEIAAILILGAKGCTEVVKEEIETVKPILFGIIKRRKVVTVERTIDRKAELAKELLENHTPIELFNLITKQLQTLQLGDFFGLTTFLIEINLLRPTKVVN